MSQLKKYLEENHDNPDKIKKDFQVKFGVNVRQEGDLFLFKYGLITARWHDVTKECRGTILRLGDHGWDLLARPFDKFFNQHEGHCPVFEADAFAAALPTSALTVKADGSCIQVWHDGNAWRVSTLGTITTLNVYDNKFTFEHLFRKTVGNIFWQELDSNLTYLFELCTEDNRIVTQYAADHAVLLAARDRSSGAYLQDIELDYEIYDGAFREANIVRPQLLHPYELGLRSLNDVKDFIEESSHTDKYGKYPEGFVLYDWQSFHPLAKMKNAKYTSLHSFGGGDIAHSKNQIIDAIFLGYVDDIYDVLSDRLRGFADDVKIRASDLTHETLEMLDKMKSVDFSTRKAYAAFVQNHAEPKVQGFFFKNANDFMKKDLDDAGERFEKWLKEHYGRFDWKEEK